MNWKKKIFFCFFTDKSSSNALIETPNVCSNRKKKKRDGQIRTKQNSNQREREKKKLILGSWNNKQITNILFFKKKGTWDGEAAATGMPQASVVPVVPTVAAPPVGAVRKSDFTYTYSRTVSSAYKHFFPIFVSPFLSFINFFFSPLPHQSVRNTRKRDKQIEKKGKSIEERTDRSALKWWGKNLKV